MNNQDLWKYFVDASYEAGITTDEEGNQKQAAYSLYTAFYEKHHKYSELKSNLIKDYFRKKEQKKLGFTSNEALDHEISAKFGEEASACIENRPMINDAQRRAIKNGLVQPVTLVQGPPGTGKTEMILNFLAVITRLSPDSTVAVVSCNSEALSNITDALAAIKERAIKNNTPNDIMVEVCDRCAILGNKDKRKEWSSKVDQKFISNMGQYVFKRTLLESYPIFTSTIHSLPNIFSKEDLFDYVIIDECSQVSVSLGLVAMEYAKHLMLVGDNLQLQAIISKEALEKAGKLPKDKQDYFEEEGKSFLKACETLFPDAPSVLLNQHYRCHQSIANFCNEYVYAAHDSRLEVKTHTPEVEMDDCRIDITWYDGVYMEKPDLFLTEEKKEEYAEKQGPLELDKVDEKIPDKKIPSQKNNFRQIDIFIKEMLPGLKEKLNGSNPPTICVLAPFRFQLQLLQERLEKELSRELELSEDMDLDNDRLNAASTSNNDSSGLPSLSIHKAQGKGYDIVYVMTVEDDYKCTRAPWGQNMRIINVAVSRAKKELHIITSRIWIPQYIQKKLPEFKDKEDKLLSPLPMCIKNCLGENPDEEDEKAFYQNWIGEREEKVYESKENFYIGRLCQWVYDNWGAGEQNNKFGSFGFRQAKKNRIFDSFTGNDKIDFYKRIRNVLTDGNPNLDRDNIAMNTSLNDAPQLAEALKNVKEPKNMPVSEQKCEPLNDADFNRKDFIFVCKDNYIKVIIHVLDCRYRDACKEEYGFLERLQWRIAKTSGKRKYIEIPTNGEFGDDVEEILKKYDDSSNALIFKENPVIKLLKSKTWECLNAVMDVLYNDDKFRFVNTVDQEENIRIINALKLNYGKATDVVYKESALLPPLTQQYYLCRYGTAYAFEYALMYDIVFRCAEAKEFQIMSLGCGSCIDALAAWYSRERLEKETALKYKGVDCVKWDVSFLDCILEYFDTASVVEQDIVGYFKKPENKRISSNIIFLPKILNELDRDTKKNLLAAAEDCSLDPNVDEYYFCASHNSSAAEEGSNVLEQFINALGNHEQYSYNVSVSSFFDFDKDESFKNMWGLKKEKMLTDTNNDGICKFNRELPYPERKIQNLNADFLDSDTDDKMKKAVNDLKNMNEKAKREFRHRITKVDEIAFQIIRLKKMN